MKSKKLKKLQAKARERGAHSVLIEPSDEVKIAKHGFDNKSFKHRKSK